MGHKEHGPGQQHRKYMLRRQMNASYYNMLGKTQAEAVGE